MPNYVNSDNIYVYPTARRGAYYPESRLLLESGLVGLVNKLIDREGFVISDQSLNPFEFNIFGYYFKISNLSYVTSLFDSVSDGDVIYGKITLDDMLWGTVELSGQDDSGKYQGIEFIKVASGGTAPTSDETHKCLALIQYDSANTQWVVVPSSKIKFDGSIAGTIDGGTVTTTP